MSNFHPFEVVGRGSETQLQVGENLNGWGTWHDCLISCDLICSHSARITRLLVQHNTTQYPNCPGAFSSKPDHVIYRELSLADVWRIGDKETVELNIIDSYVLFYVMVGNLNRFIVITDDVKNNWQCYTVIVCSQLPRALGFFSLISQSILNYFPWNFFRPFDM